MEIQVHFEGYIADNINLGTIEAGLGVILANAGIIAESSPNIVCKTHSTPSKWAIAGTFSGTVSEYDDEARDALKTALDTYIDNLVFEYNSQYEYTE